MALWGKFDAKAFETDVSVVNNDATVTTTGDFTDDTTDDYIVAGDILSLDGVQYIVKQVTDATHLELHAVYAGSTGTVSAADAIRRTAPKAAADYMIKNAFGTLVFLDEDEAVLNENRVRGLDGPGWWVYRTFTDADGNTRHKSECIVPLSVAAADSGDYADNPAADAASAIAISAQPANQSTVGPEGGLLTVDTVSAASAGRVAGPYTITTSDYSTDGTGTGATFTITIDGAGAATIDSIDTAGSGYVVDETFSIDGSVFGGTDGVDDLTFDAATVAAAAATFSVTAADSPDLGDIIYQWQTQTATGTRWTNISGATSASLALTGLTTADSGKKYRVKLTSTAGAEEVISNTATLTVTAA
jgi:hypothetical protein